MICQELLNSQYSGVSVRFERYRMLPQEEGDLISDWFVRSWKMRESQGKACFEAFFFAWIAVNGWATCVTKWDENDRGYLNALMRNSKLCQDFTEFAAEWESPLASAVKQFAGFWPIFDVRSLRRLRLSKCPDETREEMSSRYSEQSGVQFAPPRAGRHREVQFAPQCAKRHREAGEQIPVDWPHTLAALYQVRCNFFHGEKALSSEMDQQIVACASRTLLSFFQQGEYISQ